MNEIYNYIGTFLGGVVLKHLWDKVINRIVVLRYTVIHQPLALSGNDPRLGSIQVHFNEIPSNNLFLSTVTITNDSNRDVANIVIHIASDPQSTIFTCQGVNKSSTKNLFFTDKYSSLLADTNADAQSLLGYREYLVPVFNRGEILEFSMVINSNNINSTPIVAVSCDHLGVKISFQKVPPQKLFGESQLLSVLVGYIIVPIICVLLINFNVSLMVAVWTSFFLGGAAALIGVVAIKLFKRIRRFFT